jgi:hypothetical protein
MTAIRRGAAMTGPGDPRHPAAAVTAAAGFSLFFSFGVPCGGESHGPQRLLAGPFWGFRGHSPDMPFFEHRKKKSMFFFFCRSPARTFEDL